MKSVLPVILRVILVFAVACGLQYLIPWYLLAPAGVVAGVQVGPPEKASAARRLDL